ncbi:hypothetical protein ACFSJW_00605 [Flavobacterium artemisiae]|uniref:DKNYY family protein n=1 Tax=Flavobacterium artemisiae TaxID=2126556 RepID=A0ABW4HIF4_9FLAO
MIQNQTKTILSLFFLFFSFLMQAQKDTVYTNGKWLCAKNVTDIIKENKKVITYFLPEDFESDSTIYKMDSAYIYLGKSKYLQRTYTSKKIKFKTLVDEQKRTFYLEDLISKEKTKINFTESCEMVFTGTNYYPYKKVRFLFRAKYDGYDQECSLRFGRFGEKEGIIVNRGFPIYKKCKP